MSEARQGAAVLLVGGKPTVFGGFNNYDAYPTLVEQFDPKLGSNILIKIFFISQPTFCNRTYNEHTDFYKYVNTISSI